MKQTNARSLSRDNTCAKEKIKKEQRTKGLGGFMIVAHASLMDIPLAFARVNRFLFPGGALKSMKVSSSSALAKPHVFLNTRKEEEEEVQLKNARE